MRAQAPEETTEKTDEEKGRIHTPQTDRWERTHKFRYAAVQVQKGLLRLIRVIERENQNTMRETHQQDTKDKIY